MVGTEIRIKGHRKLSNKIKQVSVNIRNKIAPDLAKRGYNFARRIMPVDTGALRAALQWHGVKTSGKIIQRQPRHPDGRNRPYHLWMARIAAPTLNAGGKRRTYKDVAHPKNNTRYMKLTYDHIRAIAPKEVNKKINEAFKGF
jgi:hypothetical protein